MKTECGNKLDEKLSEVLCRAVISETESSFFDRDAFKNWLEEGERRQCLARRRKIRRIGFVAAAVFLCAVLLTGSLLLTDALPPYLQALLSPGEGVAEPNFNSNAESGNGNVVIGGDGNGNTGTWTATFASYDDIPEKYREQIIWFEEMPEGYELVEIEITQNLNDIIINQSFKSSEHLLRVKQIQNKGGKITIVEQADAEIVVSDRAVYRSTIDNAVTYTFLEGNQIVFLLDQAVLNQEKIEAMIASIKTGWSM